VILRQYQLDAARAVLNEWKEHRSTLLVMPTGCGKTVTFADICRRVFPKRVLVIVHRSEIVFQNSATIHKHTGYRVGVEMAEHSVSVGLSDPPQVVSASIQTLTMGGDGGGRMSKFPPSFFSYIICDEGHHFVAKGNQRCLDYFKQNPKTKLLMCTATPDRSDEEALGQICETVAFDYEIIAAIHDGWLVPVEQQMVTVAGLDLSRVRTTLGDLNNKDLAAVMEQEKNLHEVVSPSIEICGDRRTLVFAASVKQAEQMAEIFNRHRAGCAAWVCAKTPKDDRAGIFADYANGKIQFLCQVNICSEGWDDPAFDGNGVQVIVMAAPTKSRARYSQSIGRALRPLPGCVDDAEDTPYHRKTAIAASNKPSALVIDFVGNSGRHKLMSSADILGGNVSDKAIDRVKERLKALHGRGNVAKMLEEEEKLLIEQERRAKEEADRKEAARKAHLKVGAKYTVRGIDPFSVFDLVPVKQRAWHEGKELSEKQMALLAKQGIDASTMPYHLAKQTLDAIFHRWDAGLCSLKQASVLTRAGIPAANVTRDRASKIIDLLAKNNWRRPPDLDDQVDRMTPSQPKLPPPTEPIPF
jgi:superfamily II DNA or RNA helicase